MGDSMNVYLYPNDNSADSLAGDAQAAIASALGSTMEYFADNHNVNISINTSLDKSHPSLNEEPFSEYRPDKFTVMVDFDRWLTKNDKSDRTGAHLLIVTSWDGGIAQPGLGGAWQNSAVAVAGEHDDGTDHFKNICVQEVYHKFLNANGEYAENEHALGKVKSNPSRQTPMVTSYVDEGLDAEGTCNSTGGGSGYTLELTNCAQEATLRTYQNQGKIL